MYFIVQLQLPEADLDAAQIFIDAIEHAGVEVRDSTLKPLPGQTLLPAGEATLRVWFESEADARELIQTLGEALPSARVDLETLVEEDWAETWKQHVRSTRVGRLWVGPSWDLEHAGDAAFPIVIDPGMAFGTGDHPTTAMCLRELDARLADRPGASVLDVGTGSGVLAIAARKLGAGRVVANDIDPNAVSIARENGAINGVDGIDWTEKPLERLRGQFDLVVANIFANVLCQLAPRLAAAVAPEGVLLLTGLLDEQEREVADAFESEGLEIASRRQEGEWVLLAVCPRAP